MKIIKRKSPPSTFQQLGIKKGTTLVFIPDPNITVRTTNEKKALVSYQGKEMLLPVVASELAGYYVNGLTQFRLENNQESLMVMIQKLDPLFK